MIQCKKTLALQGVGESDVHSLPAVSREAVSRKWFFICARKNHNSFLTNSYLHKRIPYTSIIENLKMVLIYMDNPYQKAPILQGLGESVVHNFPHVS